MKSFGSISRCDYGTEVFQHYIGIFQCFIELYALSNESKHVTLHARLCNHSKYDRFRPRVAQRPVDTKTTYVLSYYKAIDRAVMTRKIASCQSKHIFMY